jgi:transketolase
MSNEEIRLAERAINALRFISVDAIQKASSGHPGLPMGAAAMAYTLWTRHLNHNPANPRWVNRDRFVLSAGHGSILLYALLYLTGYDVSLDDIKAFRQWESKTPGHPEAGVTPGVEATTGPLGQGIGNAVGMAIAEAHLAARYNRPDSEIVDHYTYVLAGDGDLMEGVAAEASSLAGHLGLGKLVVLYDDNRISLAGSTSLSFTEDVAARYTAYNWDIQWVDDGNNIEEIDQAIRYAKKERNKPSLILIRTVIGCGAPNKQNTFGCHGSPLGREEMAAAKRNLGWPVEPDFHVPDDVIEHMRSARDAGEKREQEWRTIFEHYRTEYPDRAAEFIRICRGLLPSGWAKGFPRFESDRKGRATRRVSEEVMQYLGACLPELFGGTADLNPSTLAWLKSHGDFQNPTFLPTDVQGAVGSRWDFGGRNIHYGVREHAMAAISNGLALHGGIIPFTGTFLVFADYMRPAMRLSALMGLRVIYVFSHDSIGVGEDGPTHQPVEHLMGLRTIPNLTVIRPGDSAEVVEAWKAALTNTHGPTALITSRQDMPALDRSEYAPASGLRRGGYVLWEPSKDNPEVIIIGTGSELYLALEAAKQLAHHGVSVRVVSLPCWELFDSQPEEYREWVLPSAVKARVAVEAGLRQGWERYVGLEGKIIGMDGFGSSAPASVLYEKFGITIEAVIRAVKALLE